MMLCEHSGIHHRANRLRGGYYCSFSLEMLKWTFKWCVNSPEMFGNNLSSELNEASAGRLLGET